MRPRWFGGLSGLIGLASAVLIVLATASLVHVGLTASDEADTQAARSERALFETFLRGRFHLMARDQLSVARWDRTVENVVVRLNRRYVRREIFESLWFDFALGVNLIVAADGTVLASARRDEVAFPTDRPRLAGDLAVLRDRTVARFLAERIAVDGGFLQRHVSTDHVGEIAELGFVEIDGAPHVASAMAIVPDDGEARLPDGPPAVLVSARPVDAGLLAEFTADLGFADLAFVAAPEPASSGWQARAVDDRPIGRFTWRSDTPGARIWRVIVPLILASTAILGLLAALVARHMGRLSRRLEASEAHSRHIARHDALSGLANRREIEERLAAALAGLGDRPFAWIACDLDHFKAVNDTYGHAAGDTVIRTVADRLREVVGATGTIGRIGGDEFVVLVTAFHDRPRLAVLGQEIVARVREPIALADGGRAAVGASLGIAIVTEHGIAADAVASAADAALYASKARGRGRVVFAHELTDAPHDEAPAVAATTEEAHRAA